jgi:hypothetical protein
MTGQVLHPYIPDWKGERGWNAPGEPLSTLISFVTDDEDLPYKITHNRDIIYHEGKLEQNYNFIDYYFGDASDPLRARAYMDENEAKIILPETTTIPETLSAARAQVDIAVLQYLQKRYRQISIMTAQGYEYLWSVPDTK